MTPPVSYATYVLVFVVGPLLALAASGVAVPRSRGRTAVQGGLIMVGLALAYTIPWDNALVARGVWGYADGTVLFVLWHAPVEEYVYIVLQPVLAMLWCLRCGVPTDGSTAGEGVRYVGTAWWLLVAAAGAVALAWPAGTYLGWLLAWAAPVLALQWLVGGPYLWAHRRYVAVAVGVPTLYLWTVDWLAVQWGLWTFSARYTTGFAPLGLPIEEALFFLLTTLLVVQGFVLYHWVVEHHRATVERLAASAGRLGGSHS